MTAKVLTANRLTDGIAVWWSAKGEWQTVLQGALVANDDEAAAALEAIGKRDLAANLVVDVALIDVNVVDGVLKPLRLRERIRADGPTIEYAPTCRAKEEAA
ncbi:DUF2849 domain-containing protein [Rhizobium sp. L1K21]|uniref:DUF2849 domain-containing protein n=1 Tax=Rhizobium sp. L1K21 TaxID=2954933 RepID=UPI0020937C09|nr:DUF2849 domain-containing protein [Rhizobium sp. L1K21]MCO6185894.1 DUF2849 domain-containing protein [Rhizobium sp. L1K21]